MLEKSLLLMRPWKPAPSGESDRLVRAVVDGDGATVGLVRQQPRGPRWLRWLNRRTLKVYETPDSSLVFALRRSWGWPGSWHIVDADERLVGKLRGRALLDGFGQFLAAIEAPDGNGCGRFLAIEGRQLGEYVLEPEGTRVKFAEALEGNPFAKMLLLGAVLVGDV
jgi:hypothetical protein